MRRAALLENDVGLLGGGDEGLEEHDDLGVVQRLVYVAVPRWVQVAL